MTGNDYTECMSGKRNDNFDKEYLFNSTTGKHDKTEEWDNTVLVFDQKDIELKAGIYQAMDNITEEQAMDLALMDIGAHEGKHSLQNSFDFFPRKKDANGKYKDPVKSGLKQKDYNDRDHENEAAQAGEAATEEYKKKNKIKLP